MSTGNEELKQIDTLAAEMRIIMIEAGEAVETLQKLRKMELFKEAVLRVLDEVQPGLRVQVLKRLEALSFDQPEEMA